MSVGVELWNLMGMIETSCPKRSGAWTRLFASAPTPFGSRRAARKGGPTNIGIVHTTSIFASVPTCFGNKRAARKGGPTNTGTGPVNLRRTDASSVNPPAHNVTECAADQNRNHWVLADL